MSNDAADVQLVGVTGHQQLPQAAIALLRHKLLEWFPDANGVTVVCSLAVGADTFVADFLLDRGAKLHAIVPSAGYINTFTSANDRHTYEELLGRASAVDVLNFDAPSEQAYMAAGEAVTRACDWLCAVWDGRESKGMGGTADVVALARQLRKPVRVVWPTGVER